MNKITRNISAIVTIGLGSTLIANAQVTSQKIGTNPTMKQASAVLEVESTNKGILMPRIALTGLTDALTITSPANSLTVFNTATAGTTPDNVTPGYYYWSTAENKWIRLLNQNDAAEPWQVQTTTNKATSNTQSIYQNGLVGIGDFSASNTIAALDIRLNSVGPGKGAVRVGVPHADELSGASLVGVYSGSFGVNNKTSGMSSFTIGATNSSAGSNNFIAGQQNTISQFAVSSMATGANNIVNKRNSAVFGINNINDGENSAVFGYNNITSTDGDFVIGYLNAIRTNLGGNNPIFQVGMGSPNPRNAMTILSSGYTGINILGAEAAARPTESLDIGTGNVRIRDINTKIGTATDRIVVSDTGGVLKTVSAATVTVEPWQVQAGSTKASANAQNIYQTGSVAVGDFSTAASTKKMQVKGDFKAEVTAAGGVAYGTEISHPLNPNGAMHYWLTSPTNYRIASANAQGAILQGVSGTTTNTVAASDIKSEMSSLNGSNSLSAVRAENTGNFFMESYNVTGNFGSTLSLQNDGLRLRHTNTNGAADPFPLNNSSEIFVQKANGVRFNFRDAAAVQTGEYWFPTTTGTAGQVMTQTATGKMVWSNPALSVAEVDGVIGNEVTDATANGGLTRVGAGTNVSPYTLGLTPGSATGNVMTWNGTAWNPAAAVNIYNADGLLTSDRNLGLNNHQLSFNGIEQQTFWSADGSMNQQGSNGRASLSMYGGGDSNLFIQQFANSNAQISTGGNSTSLYLGTSNTNTAAPITFHTSTGGGVNGTEKMRVTGTGNVGIATTTPSEKLDNSGITRLRTLPLNGATNAINTTGAGAVSASQDQTFTATRTVVADANGVLGTVAGLPAGPSNIYTTDGTLAGPRIVTTADNLLTFQGTNAVSIGTSGTQAIVRATGAGTGRGAFTATGGNSILDMYADNSNFAQVAARGTGNTGLAIRTEGATPVVFSSTNIERMRITPTGEVAIGTTTAPSFTVGTGGSATLIQPKLHVAGDISTTGKVWTTNSVYADYVFEKYFTGHSDLNKDYEFNSLEKVNDFIKENHHLPGVTKIDDLGKSQNGYTFDMTALSIQQLEKIEELYLHTIEQHVQLKTQYEVNEKQQEIILQQQDQLKQLKERMEKIEQLLKTKQ